MPRLSCDETDVLGEKQKAFDADAMTVTPYLLKARQPASVCRRVPEEGKGIFVVLKLRMRGRRTTGPDLASHGTALYETIAATVNELGKSLIGDSGYESSVGAVVGATFPDDARRLRSPPATGFHPGYGLWCTQGAGGGMRRSV
jgi:orotidine-5'-phosphate decarboxylase